MSFDRTIGLAPAIKRALIYAPCIVALLALSVNCFRWSLADIYATQIDYHLETVSNTSSNKNASAWRLARQQLEYTLRLRSDSPQYLELAEKFYQTLDTLETNAPELLQELGWKDNEQIALQYARNALKFRPSWSYLWEELAVSKLSLKQFDNELDGAFERALKLHPWKRSIQYEMAILGLDDWENLANETQVRVLQAMEQSLVIHQIKTFKLDRMVEHTNLAKACTMVKVLPADRWKNLNRFCLENLKLPSEVVPLPTTG